MERLDDFPALYPQSESVFSAISSAAASQESSATKESTDSVTQQTVSSETEEPKEPVVLEWYYNGNGQQADTEEVEAAVNELLKEYPGLEHVSIKLNCFTGSEDCQ